MKKIYLLLAGFLLISQAIKAQNTAAQVWVDSVFNTLTEDERIAQLMVVRLSTYDSRTKTVTFLDRQVKDLISRYNIGSICIFQGSPVKQANIINHLQAQAKTPILMCIDAEWGVGMRLIDSVLPLPRQMMLGAVDDPDIAYQYGKVVAEQCKRLGIQVNYAPVVDINNNPNNPVINDRSFGEDKYKVAQFAIQYMKGMQDNGVMACAKHFPGHGDVAVDSHFDLPVINKSISQLDSLELYPFKQMFNAGVGSVMIAHLYIPAIDKTSNRATSLSKPNVTDLMRNQLGYQGLTFTDALEMQGVKKFFPNGEAAVESLIAGNDMLCLPGDVPIAINKIKEAIKNKKLSWEDIEKHCKKVLLAKYSYGLTHWKPIETNNLTADLNNKIPEMRKLIAENALTVLSKTDEMDFPMEKNKNVYKKDVVYVGIGITTDNAFSNRMKSDYNADVFYFNYKQDANRVLSTVELIKNRYKKVIIGIHNYNRTPINNFGISIPALNLISKLQQQTNAITFLFGNPYAARNFCNEAKNLVVCYEDDSLTQQTAIDFLKGEITAKGKLPVTVCDKYAFGSGIVTETATLPLADPASLGFNVDELNNMDSIAYDAIKRQATPGCVVLIAKDGKIAYQKAFGNYTFDDNEPVSLTSIYDMASVTKICATTLAIMKLYDEGKIDLKKNLGDYLPWVKGSNKESLTLESILLHQAGLVAFIPFYKEVIDSNGIPYTKYFSNNRSDSFNVEVANNLFMRNDWEDTMYKRIVQSPLEPTNKKYIYSDNDFIFLGKIVEAVSGLPLDQYVQKEFYTPLGLKHTGFNPTTHFSLKNIVPTEDEKIFRQQLLRGYVHDPGAAMFGGVAGHAGLFSDAYDLAVIMQMLLNGGEFGGKRYLKEETVELFTSYQSNISRRGYGFDKPEKDNDTRKEPYPCRLASPLTFGHTGFTGTCVWADPAYNTIFIFLSNRVNPNGGDNKKLMQLNVRTSINELIYNALGIAYDKFIK